MLVYTNESHKTHAEDFSTAQTGAVIITPPANKRIEVHGVFISTKTTTTDAIVFFDSMLVFKLYTSTFSTANDLKVHLDGQIDEPLKITCGANTFFTIIYHFSD